MNRKHISTKSLVMTGLSVAVLSILSQISLPMPSGVPVSMQTFAVALAAYLLGPKLGVAAVAVYILLGAVGVPVYAGFSAGIGPLLGLSGGFFWGFLFMAAFCGFGFSRKNKAALAVLSAIGLALCHLLGVFQFMVLTDMGFASAALMVSVPYLLKDALSVVAAYLVSGAVCRVLNTANLAYEI